MSTVTLSASNFSDVVYTNVLQRADNFEAPLLLRGQYAMLRVALSSAVMTLSCTLLATINRAVCFRHRHLICCSPPYISVLRVS